MGHVRGRLTNRALLGTGAELEMAAVDEAMFALPGIVNFHVQLKRYDHMDHLELVVYTNGCVSGRQTSSVAEALDGIPALRRARSSGDLRLVPIQWRPEADGSLLPAKRQLMDLRV